MAEFLQKLTAFFSGGTGTFLLGLASAIVVTFSNAWISIWKQGKIDDRKSRGQLSYTIALTVATLREFSNGCADVMRDGGEDQPFKTEGREGGKKTITVSNEMHRVPSVSEPKIQFSDKIDWPIIDAAIMARLLSLEPTLQSQRAAIALASEHDGPPNWSTMFCERQMRYAEMGLITATLMKDIHTRYAMPFTSDEHARIKIFHDIIVDLAAREHAQLNAGSLGDDLA